MADCERKLTIRPPVFIAFSILRTILTPAVGPLHRGGYGCVAPLLLLLRETVQQENPATGVPVGDRIDGGFRRRPCCSADERNGR
jgi:hypothetical protein